MESILPVTIVKHVMLIEEVEMLGPGRAYMALGDFALATSGESAMMPDTHLSVRTLRAGRDFQISCSFTEEAILQHSSND